MKEATVLLCVHSELPIQGPEGQLYLTLDKGELWMGKGEDDLLDPVVSEHAHSHRVGYTWAVAGKVRTTHDSDFLVPLFISKSNDEEMGLMKVMARTKAGEAVFTILRNGQPVDGYVGLHATTKLAGSGKAVALEEEDAVELRVEGASADCRHLTVTIFIDSIS